MHVAPLGHIILIPSQTVFSLTPLWCVLSREAKHNLRSTTLEMSTLTITPLMHYYYLVEGDHND